MFFFYLSVPYLVDMISTGTLRKLYSSLCTSMCSDGPACVLSVAQSYRFFFLIENAQSYFVINQTSTWCSAQA